MTVWASFDGCHTWPMKRLVYEGFSAYSSLTAGKDGKIYLLFERGKEKLYESVRFAHQRLRLMVAVACFNLEWLSQGQDWQKFFKD